MPREVILFTNRDTNAEAISFFDTVEEAQQEAEAYVTAVPAKQQKFEIFTLFKSGTWGSLQWDFAVDTATNLIQNAKSNAVPKPTRRHAHFTNLELDSIKAAHAKGLSPAEISKKTSPDLQVGVQQDVETGTRCQAESAT